MAASVLFLLIPQLLDEDLSSRRGSTALRFSWGIQVTLFEGSCDWTANSMTILTREVFFFPSVFMERALLVEF